MATVSELIIERRNNVSKGWQSFLEHLKHLEYPSAIAEVIERKNTQLKADFVPWAPGIVIASDYLLRSAGQNSTSGRPKGWRLQPSWGDYRKGSLFVRKHGKFWMVEDNNQNVLVFTYGSMPVCTRTYEAAMWLAEYFADDRPQGHGLRWVGSAPDDIQD